MIRSKYGKIIFDEDEENYIVNSFIKNEKSITELLKEFGLRGRPAIIRVLEKYGVDYKNVSNKFGRKYFFDELYFKNIDNKEKAYWLGFLYADGYITNENIIGCGLKVDDKEHLISFLTTIKISEVHIEHNKKTNSCRFILCSKNMCDDLINLGFSNTKSYDNTSKPFDCIPNGLKKYFILGFWDGDGYVSIAKDGKNLTGVVSNNKELLLSFTEYINKEIEENFCKVANTDDYNRIRLSTNKAKKFLDWLYSELPNNYLNRKYSTYKKMTFGKKVCKGFDNWLVKGILCIESNKIYVTAKECCLSEFGVDNPGTMNNIRSCCRGERNTTRNKHFRYLTETEREDYINGEFNF